MNQADQAVQNALGSAAMADNLKAVAGLADAADRRQQEEHIRGIVATSIAHLSSDATAATRELAAQWRAWALGLADGTVAAAT